jgi:hypothetical protein
MRHSAVVLLRSDDPPQRPTTKDQRPNDDVATMDRILADDFVLVTGRGQAQTKADLLKESASGTIMGSESGKSFDYKLWFSDVYVRTAKGWRYVFGQASLRLP